MNLRKIDTLIAEHFFGWEPKPLPVGDDDNSRGKWSDINWPWDEPGWGAGEWPNEPLFPAEDIRTAWEVIDKIHSSGGRIDSIDSQVNSRGEVTYDVHLSDGTYGYSSSGLSSLPLAICLAALKLKGVTYED